MFQRNAIAIALQTFNSDPASSLFGLPPDTILLISDCDEIPRPESVAFLRERGLADGEVVTFLQRLSYYNFNTTSPQPWPGTRAARWADVAALSPHVIRCGLGQPDAYYPVHLTAPNAGWHLSYFGGPEMVKRKMESFLHQELVTATNTDPAAIAARINAGVDVWGRPEGAHGITLGEATDLPPPVVANPAAWADFFHEDYRP
jgi:beta-1,4-mannosyl-glycoprotein beta-1,4-N-acetylglucosaminyltransferase